MNIESKTRRIRTREDSQHGVRSAPEPDKVPAVVRLRSLLRGNSQSARAAEAAESPYFPTPAVGTVTPQPSNAAARDTETRQASADARDAYEALTVPELQVEIDARNNERDEDLHLPRSGRKAELVQRLLDDDSRQLASV